MAARARPAAHAPAQRRPGLRHRPRLAAPRDAPEPLASPPRPPAHEAHPAPPRFRGPPAGPSVRTEPWRRPRHPLALLLLPDRRLRLDLVDDLAGAGECGVTVRRGRRDENGRLRQPNNTDPMLRRGRTQPV